MMNSTGTYDTQKAKEISLDSIIKIMKNKGVNKLHIKRLAPNDNSKNQPYFGSHLTDLPFLPTGNIEATKTESNKPLNGRSIKYLASLNLSWIDADGIAYPAPNSKLIYYPQYPEVRFSGFLKGSKVKLSEWMAPEKKGRAVGRWLILGTGKDDTIYSFLATPNSALANELTNKEFTKTTEVFYEFSIENQIKVVNTRSDLIRKLKEIHEMGWVKGQKLDSNLIPQPYKAPNGGGYTLESLLGVSPNGYAEPDYLGWEVKQFGVKDFPLKSAKPTTLLTPEPDGGVYTDKGVIEFIKMFGYPDKSGKPDRWNFGGKHSVNKECSATNLTMVLDGFDTCSGTITDAFGAIKLISKKGSVAASWSFAKIMDHWKRKHSQAVYVPCMMRKSKGGTEYHYGKDIELGTVTNFELFLSAMLIGSVYYDPGIKVEKISTEKPVSKRRSQFRVNHKHLNTLYKNFEYVDITN
ncbi:MAG: hypothetical protein HWE18_06145 [Gammaproteobacteria bacterium]|nr:hypothetical protein [Gammaproteobacteria bacterium]